MSPLMLSSSAQPLFPTPETILEMLSSSLDVCALANVIFCLKNISIGYCWVPGGPPFHSAPNILRVNSQQSVWSDTVSCQAPLACQQEPSSSPNQHRPCVLRVDATSVCIFSIHPQLFPRIGAFLLQSLAVILSAKHTSTCS